MKTKVIQLLEQRIKDLERIIEMQDDIIKDLRKPRVDYKLSNPWDIIGPGLVPQNDQIRIPFIRTIEPCEHEYPSPWMSTTPPSCKKCGAMAVTYTVTSTNLEEPTTIDFSKFKGTM